MGYEDLMKMPWETLDWIYNRHVQELIDLQKKKNEANGINHFM